MPTHSAHFSDLAFNLRRFFNPTLSFRSRRQRTNDLCFYTL